MTSWHRVRGGLTVQCPRPRIAGRAKCRVARIAVHPFEAQAGYGVAAAVDLESSGMRLARPSDVERTELRRLIFACPAGAVIRWRNMSDGTCSFHVKRLVPMLTSTYGSGPGRTGRSCVPERLVEQLNPRRVLRRNVGTVSR